MPHEISSDDLKRIREEGDGSECHRMIESGEWIDLMGEDQMLVVTNQDIAGNIYSSILMRVFEAVFPADCFSRKRRDKQSMVRLVRSPRADVNIRTLAICVSEEGLGGYPAYYERVRHDTSYVPTSYDHEYARRGIDALKRLLAASVEELETTAAMHAIF